MSATRTRPPACATTLPHAPATRLRPPLRRPRRRARSSRRPRCGHGSCRVTHHRRPPSGNPGVVGGLGQLEQLEWDRVTRHRLRSLVHPVRHPRGAAGPSLAGALRRHLARLPGVVPPGRRRRAARPRHCSSAADQAHAGARLDLGGHGGPDRRRRRRGPHADAVGCARVRPRLLTGSPGRRRPDHGAQLRLQPRPVRVGRVLQRVHRPQGHRHQRLPVGASRRDERRRAGHLPHARRAPELRTGVRDPAGRALPAGGRRHGRRGTSRT